MGSFQNEWHLKEKWQAFLEVDSPKAPEDGHRLEKGYYIRMVNSLLRGAVQSGASDIHIEPSGAAGCRIRLRKDGALRRYMQLSQRDYEGLLGRLRIMAKMAVSDALRPDEGSFVKPFEGRRISFRVSQMPTVGGLKLVIRILDDQRFGQSLEALGIEATVAAALRRILAEKSGLVLVAGATGSGKTTTLYSMLQELDREQLNIVTIEDPVEFRLSGISQTEVAPERRLTFADGLRALLRQDPDVILLGEIRDEETASTALRAALTGHLVLSTIHTEQAPQAVLRLKNMGVPPYMIAAALKGVLAQTLRKRCDPQNGCAGRRAFFEWLEMDAVLRKAVFLEETDWMQLAIRQGMVPMSEAIRRAVCEKEIEDTAVMVAAQK